ncbi:MAG: carbonic anhydrase [Bacillales bacterium]|jgi:carbonic anhydrase|nr:carbonic anhydrase [Bacillales bacterium]
MNLLNEILEFNKNFVETGQYEPYKTTKFPEKRSVVFSCMDTRLVELLPQAMNIKNGDVKIIKNAGAVITHPFGSIMRSIIVAVYELGADEVIVIGHRDCGMGKVQPSSVLSKMVDRGIPQDTIDTLEFSGLHLDEWLRGFDCVEDSVAHSCKMIKDHPFMPDGVPIHGLVIDPETGKLDLIVNGYDV